MSRVQTASLAIILLLAFTAQSQAVTALVPNPYPYYRPLGLAPGHTYGIAAQYAIDPSKTPDPAQGALFTGAHPNVDNAFPNGIGVYSPPTGDFGIGLYELNSTSRSTGLFIQFDQLVTSSGLSAYLGHFGTNSLINGFDVGKVAPSISIYGAGGSLLGNFNAQTILAGHALTLVTSSDPSDPSYNSIFKVDTWKLDLDALVGPSVQIKGFVLSADAKNGQGRDEIKSSDPYYLLAVNGCQPVPEPGSVFLILTSALGAMIIRRRRL